MPPVALWPLSASPGSEEALMMRGGERSLARRLLARRVPRFQALALRHTRARTGRKAPPARTCGPGSAIVVSKGHVSAQWASECEEARPRVGISSQESLRSVVR